MNSGKLFFAAAIIATFASDFAHARAVLDQSSTSTTSYTAVGTDLDSTPGDRAQTFVVGITGQLTSVEVNAGFFSPPAFPLVLDVRPTDATGRPLADNASVLARATIGSADFTNNTFVPFDLSSANLHVDAGDEFAIVLRSMAIPSIFYSRNGNESDHYTAGAV